MIYLCRFGFKPFQLVRLPLQANIPHIIYLLFNKKKPPELLGYGGFYKVVDSVKLHG